MEKKYELIFSKNSKDGFLNLSAIEVERVRSYKLDKRSVLSLLYKDINISKPEIFTHIENTYQFLENISFGFDSIASEQSLAELYDNSALQENITNLIKAFDLSIKDIRIEKREIPFEEFLRRYSFLSEDPKEQAFQALLRKQYKNKKIEYSLNLKHLDNYLGFSEESSGTKQIAIYYFHYTLSFGKFGLLMILNKTFILKR